MIEQTKTITAHRKKQYTAAVAKALGFGFPVLAVIAACCISFISKMPIAIENPAILVLASLFLSVPFMKKTSSPLLQKIVAFYLISVSVNELSSQYFQISFLSTDISASYSTIVLSLCAIGYLVGIVKPAKVPRKVEYTNILYSWILAIVIIAAHMALLALMLNKFYGYGYDHNLSVMGNICLYFLLFIFLWKKLENIYIRQTVGIILTLFFLTVTIKKNW